MLPRGTAVKLQHIISKLHMQASAHDTYSRKQQHSLFRSLLLIYRNAASELWHKHTRGVIWSLTQYHLHC